jgi:ArsR family transcriptional regulator
MSHPGAKLDVFFQALGDPTRLRLLNLLAQGEICVCYFVAILKQAQPKISRHLAYLRRAGLVSARRDGKWMHYTLAQPAAPEAARLLQSTLAELRNLPVYRDDVAALSRACCAVKLPATLQDAPRPRLVG